MSEQREETFLERLQRQVTLPQEITEEEMFNDYDLWLAAQGYIEDNEYAQREYEQWKSEKGWIE